MACLVVVLDNSNRLTCAERAEVLGGLGVHSREELDLDAPLDQGRAPGQRHVVGSGVRSG